MKIRVLYSYRSDVSEAFKDQPPKVITEEEFNRMCDDYHHYLILRTGLVIDE